MVSATVFVAFLITGPVAAQTPADETAPVIIAPEIIRVEAESADGTPGDNSEVLLFLSAATATDDVDGSLPVSNDAPEVFPLGSTIVTFSATDAASNTGSSQGTVEVRDTTPPLVTSPENLTVQAETQEGTTAANPAIAAFLEGAGATDAVDALLLVVNDAPEVFPPGVTTVTFSATDQAQNTGAGSATVTVQELPTPELFPTAPVAQDFFGTVLEAQEGSLVVSTQSGEIVIVVTDETQFRIPQNPDALVTDLVLGDLVAVSLKEVDGELVADKILLIPGKTRNKQIPGVVLEVTDSSLTILPPGAKSQPITFDISSANIRFHRGETELRVDSFVVVGASRDAETGELLLVANEINVTAGKPKGKGSQLLVAPGQEPQVTDAEGDDVEPQNTAEIQGVFEGLDPDGNLIVNGTTIFLGPDTELDAGLIIGQVLDIEAVLQPDGTLLATEVSERESEDQPVNKIILEGAFTGVDGQGNWIIGGATVTVGEDTDTDGLPEIGQLVKVTGLLQADGTLLAREVENKEAFGEGDEGDDEEVGRVKLEGTFQGTDEDGNWIISGTAVAVDALTRLEGTPTVGQRVAVQAIQTETGVLLALKVKGNKKGSSQRKREAKIRGTVEEILEDGSLVIDGVPVALGPLTELENGVEIGDFVKVEALIQDDGSLLAKEVSLKDQAEDQVVQFSKVEIQGTIQDFDEDANTLVVNGITVAISALTEIEGTLEAGGVVKLEGVLQSDGTVLASEVKGQGRKATASGTEVRVDGVVEQINRNQDGDIISLVVDGLTLGLDALTEVEGEIEPGVEVSIKGIISEGQFLASDVELQEEDDSPEEAKVEVQGIIEDLIFDDAGQIIAIVVNGIEVSIEFLQTLEGKLVIGESVEIDADLIEGVLLAEKVEAGRAEPQKLPKFEFEGVIDALEFDEDGNVVKVFVEGQEIATELFTQLNALLEVGLTVEVEGVISQGRLVASKIEGEDGEDEEKEGREKGQARAEEARNKNNNKGNGKQGDKDDDGLSVNTEDEDEDDDSSGSGSEGSDDEDDDSSGSGSEGSDDDSSGTGSGSVNSDEEDDEDDSSGSSSDSSGSGGG